MTDYPGTPASSSLSRPLFSWGDQDCAPADSGQLGHGAPAGDGDQSGSLAGAGRVRNYYREENSDTLDVGSRRELSIDALVGDLNPQQRAAVEHHGGPILVVAGAGSGKTRVLTRRIAYLITQRNARPGSILAITFTNKAAAEMRERVADLIGSSARHMWVSTFHSACVRILRAEAEALNLSRSFSIYDDADSKRLISMIVKDFDLDPKRYSDKALRNWISKCKDSLTTPEQASQSPGPNENFVKVYLEYDRRLAVNNALDFDDLIMKTVQLFERFPQILEKYRRTFRHVLVDEYQDTNYAQYQLIRHLCVQDGAEAGVAPTSELPQRLGVERSSEIESPTLMVVGDSDQSIYAFRGATIRNILDFEQDFPGASTIMLEQNYRSTQTILNAANAVIEHNFARPKKTLWSAQGIGEKIIGWVADGDYQEASYVAGEIDKLVDSQAVKYSDIAIFYRTNAQSRVFEDVLVKLGIPYRLVGGTKFYDRKEVKDAIAYLRVIANPADDVSLRRILNTPKRGIGSKTESVLAAYAAAHRCSFFDALTKADLIDGVPSRALTKLGQFVELINSHRAMVDADETAEDVLRSVLKKSGYLEELEQSSDPQELARVDNLEQLVTVAAQFVGEVTAIDLDEDASGLSLNDGMPQADTSLAAFLERIALVADSDQIPDPEADGVVTLMTLHTAKGLEFDVVFLTGMEENLFPHSRTLMEPSELEEERRLAYVGITRARQQLYLTRSQMRVQWGNPAANPASRFLDEIPSEFLEWRRLGNALSDSTQTEDGWGQSSLGRSWSGFSGAKTRKPRRESENSWDSLINATGVKKPALWESAAPKQKPSLAASTSSSRATSVVAGDRVMHATFGLGTVISVSGKADKAQAEVDFGSAGKKRLLLRAAPMEKL